MPQQPKKNGSRLFIIAFAVFLLTMILVVVDMANRTTAPWNKQKSVDASADSLFPDSIFGTEDPE